jgi:hypothetical protein
MLYYIKLEHGCAIKSAESLDHAWSMAYREAKLMEDTVETVCIADNEQIVWVRNMSGHIPVDRYAA